MTITLRPGSTVLFTGDSVTDTQRLRTDPGLGHGYALRVTGEWGFRHPERPVTWLNTGIAGNKVMDLEARWQADVLDAHPDVVSILVGCNDVVWQTLDPRGHAIATEEYAAGYERLLAPLVEAGVELVLIEPFILPVRGPIEAGGKQIGEKEWTVWRADLDPKIQVVRDLARRHGAHLIATDGMFAALAATTGPEHWTPDGVHPTPAGHAALAAAWLDLVA